MKFLWGSSKLNSPHGDFDGGATGTNGSLEKDLNLAISLKIRDILANNSIFVGMTRETDKAIEQPASNKTIRQKKRADLYYRKNLIANSGAKLLVSIHMNTFTTPAEKGAVTYYSKNLPASKIFAENMQTALVNNLDPTNRRVAKEADSNIFLLKSPPMPSILIECGFISNPAEESLLNTPEYQTTLATIIAAEIQNFLTNTQ